ncbi:JAB domain-containing protein [Lacticaseibacillus sharpeae]|uniref:MPN domain-containing protein n=1 Tax=Lacticaseibacillus sharpeae JCM 1186 = DSM 20505 TaxID=1291052 RepID=A0A0R1ZIR6_9LACO|nr:DNA repair protein RadC [Lacticaseibacillus sharpeae]KRM54897.1 hypothetical protein FC18_GL001860 [Lacticaseibacillus sharpeae JCM 1186 = DSM 20505]
MTNINIDELPRVNVTDVTRELVTRLFGAANLTDQIAVNSICVRYPHMAGLAVADEDELAALNGVGPERARLLIAAVDAGEYAVRNLTFAQNQVVSSDQLGELLVRRMSGLIQEQMLVFFLNVKNEIIEEQTMFKGSIESSVTDQRVILRRALLLGSSRLIIAHNHPSGSLHPSAEDEEATSHLFAAGQIVGVNLLDHIIVGRDDYLSFREEGEL